MRQIRMRSTGRREKLVTTPSGTLHGPYDGTPNVCLYVSATKQLGQMLAASTLDPAWAGRRRSAKWAEISFCRSCEIAVPPGGIHRRPPSRFSPTHKRGD
ncbi:hypothetical protein GGTG_10175 [Gaeumannomyces tritici R3-111a-1]|uniref:Uncharacterized protein n=1 Tax=Gaeumannomyces tritici (strain R3-111a-1) TaxID=644352 RepID=J3P9J5_GAET3|nr:hypothetical protein GGTG_10175 [Gaeumannomyces tritici R3-111a-1]EJT73331.1 hypothetical protein GGTG_10175 [Gaeumannomyces tritici R3-111a-1]